MYAMGLMGTWGGRYGSFPPRPASPTTGTAKDGAREHGTTEDAAS